MLHLFVGDKQDYFLSGDGVFNNNFDMSLLLTEFSRKVIKNIDNCEVLDKYCIKSPILGGIPPERLSGGTKTLLSIKYMDDFRFYLEAMGDNCFPYLKEICDSKDVFMCTSRFRYLFEAGFDKIFIENTGVLVTNSIEFLDIEIQYGGENL